jgi:hypothetical protein
MIELVKLPIWVFAFALRLLPSVVKGLTNAFEACNFTAKETKFTAKAWAFI